jgi:S-disulfanyl-L-cysteine oxidoreductase SoxD
VRAVVAALIGIAAASNALHAQASDTSSAPIAASYTEAQAAAGGATYGAICESCHDLGYHTSDKFRTKWSGRSVYDLFTTLRATMPDDNPGGLSNDDYVRVIAYILKLNGVRAGADSLAADSLQMSRMRLALPAADSSKARTPR